MKIFYMNDRTFPAIVTFWDKVDPDKKHYIQVEPANHIIVDIDIPEGYIPYIKTWETNVVSIDKISEEIADEL
jgi:hypothetical protein